MSVPPSTLDCPASRPTSVSSSSSESSSRSGTETYATEKDDISNTRDNKDLPLPPPVLQPLRKHEKVGRAPPPQRRVAPSQHGLGWLVVIPGLIVALLSAGLATCLFLYFTLRRRRGDSHSFRDGFYIDEMKIGEGAPLIGLTGSTVITNVVWLGFPVLMGMVAYCVAASWMSQQQRPRSGQPNLPTPLQYGLLVKLLSAPGLGSTYQFGSYMLNHKKRVAAPPFLTSAFALTSIVLGLTYLISIADIWLHATASVVAVTAPSALAPGIAFDTAPGVAFNESRAGTLLPNAAPPPPAPSNLALQGHYPLAPALTYLILLYFHALVALLLTLRILSLRSPRMRPAADPIPISLPSSTSHLRPTSTTTWHPARAPTAVRLAQLHLTDALALVAARLSTRRARFPPTVRSCALGEGMFVEDVNTARLEIGVWEPNTVDASTDDGYGHAHGYGRPPRRRWGDGAGDRVFGVYKKVVPWKGEIY
ncbi:hypothetical protein C8J57DRAFT_347037 [Mycena rebaudengoi]|nr:hypothetical protein C8J57DRAFT_347037 [Mycena rebaudengoi]